MEFVPHSKPSPKTADRANCPGTICGRLKAIATTNVIKNTTFLLFFLIVPLLIGPGAQSRFAPAKLQGKSVLPTYLSLT